MRLRRYSAMRFERGRAWSFVMKDRREGPGWAESSGWQRRVVAAGLGGRRRGGRPGGVVTQIIFHTRPAGKNQPGPGARRVKKKKGGSLPGEESPFGHLGCLEMGPFFYFF